MQVCTLDTNALACAFRDASLNARGHSSIQAQGAIDKGPLTKCAGDGAWTIINISRGMLQEVLKGPDASHPHLD